MADVNGVASDAPAAFPLVAVLTACVLVGLSPIQLVRRAQMQAGTHRCRQHRQGAPLRDRSLSCACCGCLQAGSCFKCAVSDRCLCFWLFDTPALMYGRPESDLSRLPSQQPEKSQEAGLNLALVIGVDRVCVRNRCTSILAHDYVCVRSALARGAHFLDYAAPLSTHEI